MTSRLLPGARTGAALFDISPPPKDEVDPVPAEPTPDDPMVGIAAEAWTGR